MSSPSAKSSADTVVYSERLTPSFGIWFIAAALAAACILVFIPISVGAGITAAVVAALILAVLLVISTPLIRVTPDTLQVGRAQIERRFIGKVEAFRGEDATMQRGPGLNATAYMCIRGWISPVVRIEITDPADRTPYWLTSTRRPEKLVEALTSGR
ncbi:MULTISPECIES: DUF3093 domain-containing protein [unclassified Arthrobacter]|uniref:DUF3093 domain-containing protein n=1 Tax=unclassified Arthrobacter TaxID=235627 RepID=UPI001E35540A|nr:MULTISPECIES: DUF3093 domain-containing protein [unclassified Arthrobacter]MCC9145107.1 DUF3093 domain-containing protein [Arthrobacter sp. zg-Y919]MDK1276335.1 DUF3093 domain-containing protein [Arthrobacter sp. zg.Y919]MDM7988975.1 DUF3093 domain-containing protein [Arthrobacter sp. zg-Y877]WIB02061.1 DUF3093 domain-containing protein [Arthrobacter sp. zg-Y919]